MSLEELAADYRKSAGKLGERIARLRGEDKPPEDRLVPLRAEYYQLLRTASYLASYYGAKGGAKPGRTKGRESLAV